MGAWVETSGVKGRSGMTNANGISNHDAIIAARDSLTEDNWIKGTYFSANLGKVCMCAHGALQAQVNPRVIAALSDWASDGPPEEAAVDEGAAAAARWGREAGASAALAANTITERYGLLTLKNMPRWVAEDGLEAHYILGMVGLTTSFNDDKKTNLSAVKAKFTAAAELAKQLEAT